MIKQPNGSFNIFDSYEAFRDAFDDSVKLPNNRARFFAYVFEDSRRECEVEIDLESDLENYAKERLCGRRDWPRETSHKGCGRWNFTVGRPASCAVYESLERIRLGIFDAMQNRKTEVVISWVDTFHYPKGKNYQIFVDDEKKQNSLDYKSLSCKQAAPIDHGDPCYCDFNNIHIKLLEEYIKHLTRLLESSGCQVIPLKLSNRKVLEQVGTLDALRISWNPANIPNYPLPMPPPIADASNAGGLLLEAYTNGKHCDFEFQCGNDSVKAHKLLLALASPHYFGVLQESGMKEMVEGKMRLEDASKTSVKAIVDFIYTGINPFKNDESLNAVEILRLAHNWELPLLVGHATNFIGSHIDLEDAEECHLLGQMGLTYKSKYLLEVYNCIRMRKGAELPKELVPIMKEMGIFRNVQAIKSSPEMP